MSTKTAMTCAVPEGAYTYSRVGYMHLEADGWHCHGGVGTGP